MHFPERPQRAASRWKRLWPCPSFLCGRALCYLSEVMAIRTSTRSGLQYAGRRPLRAPMKTAAPAGQHRAGTFAKQWEKSAP